ncbi:ALB3.2 [Symbiodinium sp. KB8]|nr:ALB3.2 [Symbiodinium sp. KB8]
MSRENVPSTRLLLGSAAGGAVAAAAVPGLASWAFLAPSSSDGIEKTLPRSLRGGATQEPTVPAQHKGASHSWTFLTAGAVAGVAARRRATLARGPEALPSARPAPRALRRAVESGDLGAIAQVAATDPQAAVLAMQAATQAATDAMVQLTALLGPPQAAEAAEATAAAAEPGLWDKVSAFFFDPRLQWDENGNILLDPQGNPLPDNLWTQFVAFQATLIKRLDEAISGLGIPQSFGFAVATYTLLIRTLLYPFVKGQLETTAKIQVLAPRVNEIREKYKDDEERLQQEVGMLYMDLQVDPLGAVLPLLLQLPVFWGLYRAIRRLAIVEYPHLKEPFLWIPSLYGPNFKPDPSFDWITQWQGPLIELHPKIGWETFSLYAILPAAIFVSYRYVLSEALEDENAPKLLQFTPFLLSFLTIELPQAMGIYIATNIASSLALTTYTKNQISSQIPGYEEFVKTGKWPPGVDPEKVLAKAFGVKRLTAQPEDPQSVPEEEGRKIDEFDDRGIPASMCPLKGVVSEGKAPGGPPAARKNVMAKMCLNSWEAELEALLSDRRARMTVTSVGTVRFLWSRLGAVESATKWLVPVYWRVIPLIIVNILIAAVGGVVLFSQEYQWTLVPGSLLAVCERETPYDRTCEGESRDRKPQSQSERYTLALDNADLLERLFELGADPRVRDKRGNTLLHYASGYGSWIR